MDRVVEVQRQVDILVAKNKGYDKSAKLETEKRRIKRRLRKSKEGSRQGTEEL